jgi:hypothetical protein
LSLHARSRVSAQTGKTPEEIRKTFNIKNDFTPVRFIHSALCVLFRVLGLRVRWLVFALCADVARRA